MSVNLPDSISVFNDDSGTHALNVPLEDNHLFCLTACLFTNAQYQLARTRITTFKQKYLGYAQVPLHLHSIRAGEDEFRFLRNAALRRDFIADMETALYEINTKLIACVVDKQALQGVYEKNSWNPYDYALMCILERVFFEVKNTSTLVVHCIAEKRGGKEDNKFRAKFDEFTKYGTSHIDSEEMASRTWGLEIMKKHQCEPGLEIADLFAQPIRNHCAGKEDRLWPILEPKFRRDSLGRIEGWGLIKKP